MTEGKKRGRPEKDNTLKPVSLRIDDKILHSLDLIAENQTKKTGFNITRTDIVRKVLTEYIRDYAESEGE